jgi:D-amino-acid dehydrogenase
LAYETVPPPIIFSMPAGSVRPWLELFWLSYLRLADIALDVKEKGGMDIEYGAFPHTMLAFSERAEDHLRNELTFIRNAGYYDGEWLTAEDLRSQFPDLNPKVRGGLNLPFMQVEPFKYTLGLAQSAEKMGAGFRQGEVVGFGTKGGRVSSVKLASGTEIEADVVVIAMGPWSGQGASWLGKDLPIMLNRAQLLRVEVPRRLPLHGLATGRCAVIPKVNGEVILGPLVDDIQQEFDSSLTEESKNRAITESTRILPSLEHAKIIEHRGDLEGWSPPPNHIQPVLGRLPEWDNAYLAARMGTLGITMSAGVGHVMADLIVNNDQPSMHFKTMMEHLSPARVL